MTAFGNCLRNTHPIIRGTFVWGFSGCLLIIGLHGVSVFVPNALEVMSGVIEALEYKINWGFTPDQPTDFVI